MMHLLDAASGKLVAMRAMLCEIEIGICLKNRRELYNASVRSKQKLIRMDGTRAIWA